MSVVVIHESSVTINEYLVSGNNHVEVGEAVDSLVSDKDSETRHKVEYRLETFRNGRNEHVMDVVYANVTVVKRNKIEGN